jgi:hypothetical protein
MKAKQGIVAAEGAGLGWMYISWQYCDSLDGVSKIGFPAEISSRS